MLRISRTPSQAMACDSVTTGVRRAYSAELATRMTWPASDTSRWISRASSAALASNSSSEWQSPREMRITSVAICGSGGSASVSSAIAARRV
jgi:hypothetical protein